MSDKLLFFIKSSVLHIPTDFNSVVADGIKRITNDIFNRRDYFFVITDAQKLFTVQNLTKDGFYNAIHNKFDIPFNKLNLDCTKTDCRQKYEIDEKTRNKLNLPYIHFIALSKDYTFVREDKETVTILIGEDEVSFDIQSLDNIGVRYDFQP